MLKIRLKFLVVAALLLTVGTGLVTAQILGRLRARRAPAQAPNFVAMQDKEVKKGPTKAPPGVFENAKAYMEAYNRHDVKALLGLFTDDCVIIEVDGDTINGLKELEAD